MPVELALAFSTTSYAAGESPRYKVAAKNPGCKTLTLEEEHLLVRVYGPDGADLPGAALSRRATVLLPGRSRVVSGTVPPPPPGRYRAEAVYAPFGLEPELRGDDQRLKKWVSEVSGALLFRSPEVRFEVAASTQPL